MESGGKGLKNLSDPEYLGVPAHLQVRVEARRDGPMRLYEDLAEWWACIAPPERWRPQAAACLGLARGAASREVRSVLELGSGVGAMASQLPGTLDVVLIDRAPAMLAESRRLNPTREHHCLDMRQFDLGRVFDAVLLHDAVMYLTRPEDLYAAVACAARALSPGGALVLVPDITREFFEERCISAGPLMGPDGASLSILEWHWETEPGAHTTAVEMVWVLREASGEVRTVHERHTLACFPSQVYVDALRAAGLQPVAPDPLAAADLDGLPFVALRP